MKLVFGVAESWLFFISFYIILKYIIYFVTKMVFRISIFKATWIIFITIA